MNVCIDCQGKVKSDELRCKKCVKEFRKKTAENVSKKVLKNAP